MRRSCAPGLLLLAGLVVSAIVALILARGMVRPIRTLSEGARRIGEGDLDQRIDVKTGDELEALADRFNRMSGQLKESYAGLERKVEERTSELKNSLEQQTAISEILRVISASPTDVKPVLEAVAERAAHLCAATYARVLLIDGTRLDPIAGFQDGHPATDDELAATAAVPLDRTSLTGRAGIERRTIHEPDIVPLLEHEYPGARSNMEMFGLRAVLVVPLMRESGAYGGIILARTTAGPFRDDQVALVETFRKPGRHRDRQRSPVQRDEGSAGPADGDQRSPARHLRFPRRRAADADGGRRAGDASYAMRRRRRSCWWMPIRCAASPRTEARARCRKGKRCRSTAGPSRDAR